MRRALVATAAALAGAALVACNLVLGIEVAPLIPSEAGATEAGPRAQGQCAVDADCVAPNGCYVPRCDTTTKACVFDLCPVEGTCSVGECDTSTFTCLAPKPYGFRTTSYPIAAGGVGCRDANACFAAAYPFAFVGTRSEVLALRVDELLARSARDVPIDGLDFVPDRLVVSGRRLWALGALQGEAPPFQLPIGVVDVPSDPTTPRLRAERSTLTVLDATLAAYPAPDGALFLVVDDPARGYPTTTLAPPLPTGASLVPDDAGVTGPSIRLRAAPPADGTRLVGSTGTRLLLHTEPATFRFVENAGRVDATLGEPLTLLPAPALLGPARFALGANGAVLAAQTIAGAPGPACECTREARLQWIVEDAAARALTDGQLVTAEPYVDPFVGTCGQCPPPPPTGLVAWTDPSTAVVASPGGDARAFAAVTVATHPPPELRTARRHVTSAADDPAAGFADGRVALAGSAGFAYLLVGDAAGTRARLHVLDPRCDARP